MKFTFLKNSIYLILSTTLLNVSHAQITNIDNNQIPVEDLSSQTELENTVAEKNTDKKVILPKKKAGGISLGATRVIYPLNAKQTSVSITNHSGKDRYLVNSWVQNEKGEKIKDFLVTPPLFVAEPDTENTLRIISLVANKLPQDRESVFWLNMKSIPSSNQEELLSTNTIQLAINTRVKLFVRPENLKENSTFLPERLSFSKSSQGVTVENKSPYFITLVNIKIDDKPTDSVMAAPLSSTKITDQSVANIKFQTVNDYGGLTPTTEVKLN